MAYARKRAIIAVFGSTYDEAIEFARRFGAVIAARGQVLLTGGREAGTERASESAIAGAGSSPWIGVTRTPARIDGSPAEAGIGFIIATDLDHKRNYLEAHLCDAAVGLRGDKGTRSEVTFALALHRPVAFVGDDWKPTWDLGSRRRPDAGVRASLLTEAFGTVGEPPSGRPKLDALLNPTVVTSGLQRLPAYRYFRSGARPELVIDWLLRTLPSPPNLVGSFPDIEGYERVASKYEQWLERKAI